MISCGLNFFFLNSLPPFDPPLRLTGFPPQAVSPTRPHQPSASFTTTEQKRPVDSRIPGRNCPLTADEGQYSRARRTPVRSR